MDTNDRVAVIALALMLTVSGTLSAMQRDTASKAWEAMPPSALSATQPSGRLLACLTWEASKEGAPDRVEVRCGQGSMTVGCASGGATDQVELRKNPAPVGPSYNVYFIGGWPDSPKTLSTYPEEWAGLLNLYWGGGEDNLVIEWVAGDRGVIQVFHLGKGGARLVLDEGPRGGFEVWHDAILLYDAALGVDSRYHCTATEIRRWDPKEAVYRRWGKVPCGQTIDALKTLWDQDE
jgi:hypothetical protein